MATQSVRIGWRPYVAVVQTATYLLDSYSGAAAAYSLRKIKSSYTGSAIRVRRSSDNTELNIGFDSDGNLDTIALSSFVGTGDGFVTTWYDQSGNGRDSSQTTAASQPSIILSGAINTQNNKPSMYFNGSSSWLACSPFTNSTYQVEPFSLISVMGLNPGYSTTGVYCPYGTYGSGQFRLRIINNKYEIYNGSTNLSSSIDVSSGQKIISNIYSGTDKLRVNGVEVISGNSGNTVGTIFGIGRSWWSGWNYNGFIQEFVIYPSDQISNVVGLESSINTYYSAYPNPSSVWNLLTASYNADAVGSSSLNTSLFASYNGESNTNDSKGTNNGTAVGGVTYPAGKIGNAFQFNGTNALVSLPNTSGQFNFDGDFTVSVWFRTSNLSASRYFMSNYQNNGTTYGYGWSFFYSGSLGWVFHLTNGANVNQVNFQSGYSANTWYHVVAVRKMGQKHKIYVNGVDTPAGQFGNVNTTAGYIANQKMDLGGISSLNLFALCDLDGVNMWNKALTQSEVIELYNSGNGAQYIGDNFYKPTTNDALNTNNGTAQGGLTYGLGKVGTAFVFNGTTAAVRLPDNSLNSLTGDFSISNWVYLPPTYLGTGGATVYMLWNVTAPTWANNLKGIALRITSNTIVGFTIWDGVSSASVSFNDWSSTYLKNNSWVHITATRKGSTGSKLYLNGVLVSSNTSTMNPVYSSTFQTPNIGNLRTTNSSGTVLINNDFAFNGTKIDGLSVWSKELTQTEITELYNSGNGKQYPN